MHDSKNMISVQNLTATLASTFSVVAEKDDVDSNSGSDQDQDPWLVTYASAFWETIAREWNGVDSHRVDKMLLLIRFVVRETFKLCCDGPELVVGDDGANNTVPNRRRVESQIAVFEKWPLSPRERKVMDGLRYHVLDVWVDELAQCQKQTGEGKGDEAEKEKALVKVLELLMRPVDKCAKEALSKGVRNRAKETIKDFRERILDQEEQ